MAQDLCRLCAQKKKILLDLFNNEGLVQKIKDTLQVQMIVDDPLPKSICFECRRHVEAFYAFKIKCSRAGRKLNSLLTKSKNCAKGSLVKEEAPIENDEREVYISLDHDYAAPAATASVSIVKTETTQESYNSNEEDVVLEDIVTRHVLCDVKHPVIKVINEEEPSVLLDKSSKIEVEVFQNDTKLIAERSLEEQSSEGDQIELASTAGKENNAEAIEEVAILSQPLCNQLINEEPQGEFNESDLMLEDGEVCTIDYEKVEAEILKKVNPNVRFKCWECRCSFKFYSGLKKHQISNHTVRAKLTCNFCKEEGRHFRAASVPSLKSHIRTLHKRESPYSCSYCDATFRSFIQCLRHKKSHNECHSCVYCGKSFLVKREMLSHMKVHTKVKPYECHLCGKKFSWRSSLRAHSVIHSGNEEKDWLCANCGKKFNSRNILLQHLETHQNERYYCECGKVFSSKRSCYRHSRSHYSRSEKSLVNQYLLIEANENSR